MPAIGRVKTLQTKVLLVTCNTGQLGIIAVLLDCYNSKLTSIM